MRNPRVAALPAAVALALAASPMLLSSPALAQQTAGPPAFVTFPRLGLLGENPQAGTATWSGPATASRRRHS